MDLSTALRAMDDAERRALVRVWARTRDDAAEAGRHALAAVYAELVDVGHEAGMAAAAERVALHDAFARVIGVTPGPAGWSPPESPVDS